MLEAVMEGLRRLASSGRFDAPLAISFSAAMHSLLILDAQDRPLTALITWADTRSQSAADALHTAGEAATLHQETGVPVHPMSPMCKLIWLQETAPALMKQAKMICGIKEYILFQLTGQWVMDHSMASATGLFNRHTLDWHPPALALAGIRREQLPALVTGTNTLPLHPRVAETVPALKPWINRVPVVPGASDGCLANLGSGARKGQDWALTIGTSGALRATVEPFTTILASGIFQYALLPGLQVCGGPINNGGVALCWFAEAVLDKPFRESADIRWYMEEALAAPAGCEGLTCLPWLLGERAPIWDAHATAIFDGLTIRHTRKHMMRALVEGIIFSLKAIGDQLATVSGTPERILASGGFMASENGMQLIADIFECPVDRSQDNDASAMGAAMMGFMAVDRDVSQTSFSSWHQVKARYLPRTGTQAAYRDAYQRFRHCMDRRRPGQRTGL